MRLLIVGATGGTGRELVRQALERGHDVTAFARGPSRLDLTHERLTIVRGDVLDLDPASVDSAVAGQDAVLCALGHKRWLTPNRILSEGTRNLVRAMEKGSVRRFVCETALGVGDSRGRMGVYYTLFVGVFILPFYFFDKARQERVIRKSSLDWVIVRPAALTNGPARGAYRHGPDVGHWFWTFRISRADVADFMLNQAAGDAYVHRSPGVAW